MATLSLDSLESAFQNGEIDGRGFHPERQIETMNRLLARIQAGEIDSFELSKWAGLHHCTVLIYCRWLASKGLIQIVHQGQGGVCRYRKP